MVSDKRPVIFDDDNPEWTGEDFAKARPAAELLPAEVMAAFAKPRRGRPAKADDDRKQKVNIRLSPDVLAALRASGRGWQTRADELLREGLRLRR